jgi:hypothetical protein
LAQKLTKYPKTQTMKKITMLSRIPFLTLLVLLFSSTACFSPAKMVDRELSKIKDSINAMIGKIETGKIREFIDEYTTGDVLKNIPKTPLDGVVSTFIKNSKLPKALENIKNMKPELSNNNATATFKLKDLKAPVVLSKESGKWKLKGFSF